jgi:integration host factor subunit alpha
MTLTKADIFNTINEQTGLPHKEAVQIVETIIAVIKRTLGAGEYVLISGFGKFEVMHKGKRRGRNPATGTDMMLRERKVISFKCSGILRERINHR